MAIVSRRVGLQRLTVALPFLAAATIAGAHEWSSDVVLVGMAWSAVAQLVIVGVSRTAQPNRGLAVAATAAFWMGPASWLWAATRILTGSLVIASIVAVVGGLIGMLVWIHVTAAGHRNGAREALL